MSWQKLICHPFHHDVFLLFSLKIENIKFLFSNFFKSIFSNVNNFSKLQISFSLNCICYLRTDILIPPLREILCQSVLEENMSFIAFHHLMLKLSKTFLIVSYNSRSNSYVYPSLHICDCFKTTHSCLHSAAICFLLPVCWIL